MKVFDVVITSPPGPTPAASSDRCSALVPLFTATQCCAPQNPANSRSNAVTSGPPLNADEAHTRFPAFRPAPDSTAVLRAAAAIKASMRPVIVADRGATISDAGAAIAKLAEKIQAPGVATPDAKAILTENHPLFFGTMGLYGRSGGNHIVSEADLVIYCGSNTSDHTPGVYKMPKDGTPIIQIDIDPQEIGKIYPVEVGIVGDAKTVLSQLIEGLRGSNPNAARALRVSPS